MGCTNNQKDGFDLVLNKIIRKLRISLFPTIQDKEIARWLADGGDERFRYDYDLNEESLAIDLGGYKGQWASDIYSRYNCRILVFEPVKYFAKRIEERFIKNSKIEVFTFALGESNRKEIIGLGDDGSSVFKDSPDKETIQFEDAEKFFDRRQVESIDLMKINVEGGEYELIPRLCKTGLINIIQNIQVQFHNVLPDSKERMEHICEELSKTHSPTYQYKFIWENWVRRD